MKERKGTESMFFISDSENERKGSIVFVFVVVRMTERECSFCIRSCVAPAVRCLYSLGPYKTDGEGKEGKLIKVNSF